MLVVSRDLNRGLLLSIFTCFVYEGEKVVQFRHIRAVFHTVEEWHVWLMEVFCLVCGLVCLSDRKSDFRDFIANLRDWCRQRFWHLACSHCSESMLTLLSPLHCLDSYCNLLPDRALRSENNALEKGRLFFVLYTCVTVSFVLYTCVTVSFVLYTCVTVSFVLSHFF